MISNDMFKLHLPNFGHNFVLTMYRTLFPYISADNRSLDEIHNADLLNNCFENHNLLNFQIYSLVFL